MTKYIIYLKNGNYLASCTSPYTTVPNTGGMSKVLTFTSYMRAVEHLENVVKPLASKLGIDMLNSNVRILVANKATRELEYYNKIKEVQNTIISNMTLAQQEMYRNRK